MIGQITQEQIQDIQAFAQIISQRITATGEADDFERKRQMIELLDVQVKLNLEDGERVMYLSCALGQETMFIVSSSNCRWRKPKSRSPGFARR